MGKINLSPRIRESAFRMKLPGNIPVEEIGLKKDEAGETVEDAPSTGSHE